MQLFCSPPKHNDSHGPHYYYANETDLSNKKRSNGTTQYNPVHPKKKKKTTKDQNSLANEQ